MLEISQTDPPDEYYAVASEESDINIVSHYKIHADTENYDFKSQIKISDISINNAERLNFSRTPAKGILNGILISIPMWAIILYAVKIYIHIFL